MHTDYPFPWRGTNCTFAFNDGGTLEDQRAAALNVDGAGAASVLI